MSQVLLRIESTGDDRALIAFADAAKKEGVLLQLCNWYGEVADPCAYEKNNDADISEGTGLRRLKELAEKNHAAVNFVYKN